MNIIKADEKKIQQLIDQLEGLLDIFGGDNKIARAKIDELKRKYKDPPSEGKTQSRDLEVAKKPVEDHVTELPPGWTIKTVKPAGNPRRLNSPKNPTQSIRKRRLSQKTKTSSRPARRTVKSQSTSSTKTKSKTTVAQADKKVTCKICGKKVMFRNLSKHRKKEHPGEASKSAKKGAQVRITSSSRSKPSTQDTLQRMEDLKRQVTAMQKRSK